MHRNTTCFSLFMLLALTCLLSTCQAGSVPIPTDTFAAKSPYEEPRKDVSTINELVGDGNRTQEYYYIQLTHNKHCSGGSCEITHAEAETFEVSWSYDFSFGLVASMFNIGFGLEKEFTKSATTEVASTCKAEDGEHVCIWWRQAYTSLLVNVTVIPTPKWLNDKTKGLPSPYDIWLRSEIDYAKYPGNPVRIRLPNANKMGSGSVCGRGDQCITTGATKWGTHLAPGGPQKYPYEKEFM